MLVPSTRQADTSVSACNAGADDEHLDKILEAAANLPFLSAIILVANGSVARETMNIKNVFTLLRGNMPDAVLDNTLAVFTNCNSLTRWASVILNNGSYTDAYYSK